MTQQIINVGSVAGDGLGDKGQVPFQKCNANFTELYDAVFPANILFPVIAAETNAGLTPNTSISYGDVRRYGVVANNPALATANTLALKALFNQTSPNGPSGNFFFTNITGADVYYFNGVVPLRDGISLDLCGSTIQYQGAVLAQDTDSGFLFAIRNFQCFNGSITCVVDTTLATSSGYAIQIGSRDVGAYFTIFDSLLPEPMGKCEIHDLDITINNTGANVSSTGAIGLLGGLRDVKIYNNNFNGSGTTPNGIDYEFGWATSGTTDLRQTSHAHNLFIDNNTFSNFSAQTSSAVTLAGAYNAVVQNLYCNNVGTCVDVSPGESLFYRPWAGVDTVGVKKDIILKNIVGQSLTSTGISLVGATSAAGGYLASLIAGLGHPADYIAQTDLGSFTIEGFALDGSGNIAGFGNGIEVQGCIRADIRLGSISGGFGAGVSATDETNALILESVGIHGCTTAGVTLGGFSIWSPARRAKVAIRNCYIAGNSTSSAGTYGGISVGANYDSVLIENNRLNYEAAFHGTDETTQGCAVIVDIAGAANVVCKNNRVGVVVGGGNVAFFNLNNTPPSLGFYLEGNTGTTTYSGLWDGVPQTATIAFTCATPGNLAQTVTLAKMDYIKRGQLIDYSFAFTTSAFTWTTASGTVMITGLPYEGRLHPVRALHRGWQYVSIDHL